MNCVLYIRLFLQKCLLLIEIAYSKCKRVECLGNDPNALKHQYTVI